MDSAQRSQTLVDVDEGGILEETRTLSRVSKDGGVKESPSPSSTLASVDTSTLGMTGIGAGGDWTASLAPQEEQKRRSCAESSVWTFPHEHVTVNTSARLAGPGFASLGAELGIVIRFPQPLQATTLPAFTAGVE
jgi:hypothetical protein